MLIWAAAALCFMLGASFFSFLNVVVWRLPRGESVVHGRSRCPRCGRTLAAPEMIPCVSYLALRGRCRSCGNRIPVRDFWVELLGGAGALLCLLRTEGDLLRSGLFFAVLFILMTVALLDWDTMEIPDRFHVLLILCAACHGALFPETGITERLLGCLCVSVPMLVIALVIPGGFGGGDIKLMFALGLLLGWKGTLLAAFLGILSGGAWCGVLLAKGQGRKAQFPFGPFLCLGGGVSLLFSKEILAWYTAFG